MLAASWLRSFLAFLQPRLRNRCRAAGGDVLELGHAAGATDAEAQRGPSCEPDALVQLVSSLGTRLGGGALVWRLQSVAAALVGAERRRAWI